MTFARCPSPVDAEAPHVTAPFEPYRCAGSAGATFALLDHRGRPRLAAVSILIALTGLIVAAEPRPSRRPSPNLLLLLVRMERL